MKTSIDWRGPQRGYAARPASARTGMGAPAPQAGPALDWRGSQRGCPASAGTAPGRRVARPAHGVGPAGGRRRQEGVTLVLMAMLLTGLCGMAAMAVDVGVFYTAKSSAQSAADAGALAGAFSYLTPQATAAAAVAAAKNAAIAMAEANSVLGQPVSITAADVTVTPADNSAGVHDVMVTVPRTGANGIPTFFATIFGMQHADVVATSTAEYVGGASGAINVRPIIVPNTVLSPLDTASACAAGQVLLDASGELTSWARNQIGVQTTLQPTVPNGTLQPSQFYALDFGGAASLYRCALGSTTLAACGIAPAIAACGSTYATESGDMTGPTEQGVSTLLGGTPDAWTGPGAYQHSNGSITDTSPSLIVAPVWDSCGTIPSRSRAPVTTIGFSHWFVQGDSGSGIQANFVNAAGCPTSGGSCPTGGPTNAAFGIPIRLVTPAGE